MKRLEAYLKNSDKKDKVMLYASFPILVFIFYYNFIYDPFIVQEEKLNKSKKQLITKISTIKSNKVRYEALQKEHYKLQTEIETLLQDYRYAKISFNSLELIKLSEEKFLSIIEYLLLQAKKRKLDTSLNIDKNVKIDKHFNNTISITIDGKGDYPSFVRYIKDIENINTLAIFDTVFITEVAKDIKSIEKIKDSTKTPFSLEIYFSKIDAMDFMKLLSDRAKSMKISLNTSLKNMGMMYVSGKGEYSQVNSFIKYLRKLKNVKINRVNVSVTNIINVSKTNNLVNRKSFKIKFNLVGIK
jgi:hypothetical protein